MVQYFVFNYHKHSRRVRKKISTVVLQLVERTLEATRLTKAATCFMPTTLLDD